MFSKMETIVHKKKKNSGTFFSFTILELEISVLVGLAHQEKLLMFFECSREKVISYLEHSFIFRINLWSSF